MDGDLARKLGIKLLPSPDFDQVLALDGHPLNQSSLLTKPVERVLGGNHVEWLAFMVADSPQVPVILGSTWQTKH